MLAAALLLVLEGHLQGDLGRGRAGVGVEDAGEAGRGDRDQAGGQLGGAGVGEAEHGRVGDPVELLAARRASIAGWRWPWTLHQSEEMPSM